MLVTIVTAICPCFTSLFWVAIMYDTMKIKNYIESLGGIITKQIVANNKWHQFKLDSNHSNKSGGYKIFTDTHILIVNLYKDSNLRPAGLYKLYLLSDHHHISPEQIAKNKRIVEQNKAARVKETFEGGFLAYQYFNSISFDKNNISLYLQRKKAFNFGCKVTPDGDLIIPFRNIKGFVRTLQIIKPNGFKLFYKNCELTGSMHRIGFQNIEDSYSGVIYIGEGYATVASIHMAVKLPCVVAGISGNLIHVTEAIMSKYPNARILITADNDPIRNVAGGLNNPGLSTAISICETHPRISLIFPPWRKQHTEESDFNDWHIAKGLGSLTKLINSKTLISNLDLLQEAKEYLSLQLSQ